MKNILRGVIGFSCSLALCAVAFAESAKIQGRVKEENGKALNGVTVKATRSVTRTLDNPNKDDKSYNTKTDDKGDFVLEGLAAGSYVITFELTRYKTFITRRFEIQNGESFKIPRVIEMRREEEPTSKIRGSVLDSTGYSLPRVRVILERIDGKKFKKVEKYSVDGGEFGFSVPSEKGNYRVTASADGFVTASKEIEIGNEEIRNVVLQLEKKP